MIDLLSKHLRGQRYDKSGITKAAMEATQGIDQLVDMSETDRTDCKKYIEEFCEWFGKNI